MSSYLPPTPTSNTQTGFAVPRISARITQVPVIGVDRDHLLGRPAFTIKFTNPHEREGQSKGVNFADLFRATVGERPILNSWTDIIYLGTGMTELKFRINWPGYESHTTVVSLITESGSPVTRLELARNIMYAYVGFFRKVMVKRIRTNQVGPYMIALNQNLRGTGVDSEGVKWAELHLVELREPVVGDTHWVTAVDIVQARA